METRASHRLSGLWSKNFGYLATRSLQVLLVGALAAIIIKMALSVQLALLPVLIALILVSALWPLVRKLRHKMSDLAAAWTVLAASFLALTGIITFIYFAIRSQWGELSSKAVDGFIQAKDFVLHQTPFITQEQIDGMAKGIQDFVTSTQFGAGALSGLSAVGNFGAGLVLTFVILFFFLKDGDKMWRFALSWIPEHSRDRWGRSGMQTVLTLGDYIRGTAIVSAVDTIGIGAALLILQVPLAIPLSVIVFIGGFIPMVGATAAGVIAALVTLVTNDLMTALIVAAVVVAVNQLEGNLLQPKVMSKALSVHGLVILVSLTIGTVLGGIIGAILAVPLTATVWSVIKIWTERQSPEEKRRLNHSIALERLSKMNASV